MKLNFRNILFLCVCMFAIFSVNAESFQCEYKFENKGASVIFNFEYDITNGTFKNLNTKKNETHWSGSTTRYNYSYNFLEGEIKTYSMNRCPILFMTYTALTTGGQASETGLVSPSHTTHSYYFFSDSYGRDAGGPECVGERDTFCWESLLGRLDDFRTGVLTSSDINKNNKLVSICPNYDIVYNQIEVAYKGYKDCLNTSNMCESNINEANKNINELKSTCKSILTYRDVMLENEAGELMEDACVISCLDISKKINNLKNQYGIQTDSEDGKCGFSGKLIQFIANIIKWVKYIIPVIVIVLGILDFIKAISADKDDEMKKAQGRFVKRLIAAALIFIIPFIIEFVLDKMGFGANGCGIIDL